jgi:hypothetical protein
MRVVAIDALDKLCADIDYPAGDCLPLVRPRGKARV